MHVPYVIYMIFKAFNKAYKLKLILWLMHGMLHVPFVCLAMVLPMFFYVFYSCLKGRQSLILVHK